MFKDWAVLATGRFVSIYSNKKQKMPQAYETFYQFWLSVYFFWTKELPKPGSTVTVWKIHSDVCLEDVKNLTLTKFKSIL